MKNFVLISFIITLGCSAAKMSLPEFTELSYPAELPVVKRSEWGWTAIDTAFKTHTIRYITVHHGGVIFADSADPAKHVRNLQDWSRAEKKWVDIPYHFMISPDGRIFETRPVNIPGDTNTEYDPTTHLLVEVMGNFEEQEFGEKQYDSMIALIKFLSACYDVPANRVKTHRDYSNMTVCPGKNVYILFTDGKIEKALSE